MVDADHRVPPGQLVLQDHQDVKARRDRRDARGLRAAKESEVTKVIPAR